MAAPTTSILDNFNRADGPLGSNWAIDHPGSTLSVVSSNKMTSSAALASDHVYWTPTVFGADQETYISAVTNLGTLFVLGRMQGAGTNTNGGVLAALDTGGTRVTIWTYTNSTLITQVIPYQTIAAATGLWLNCFGTLFTAYALIGGTWTFVGAGSDATYTQAGNIGVSFDAGASLMTADDFGGGSLTGSSDILLPMSVSGQLRT